MNKPQLTICVPVYNGANYLNDSIGSILGQTYANFTLLCYDDGSTDNSVEILKSFKDKRIKIIEGKENRGGIYARAQLINVVKTEYCMWLDDDDRYCRTDAVAEAMHLIKSNDYDMVNFIRIDEVDKDGNHEIKQPILYGDFSYCGDKLFEKFYPTDNHFIFHSKIFRTALLKKSVPGEEILSKRFCSDDMFFAAMWFFHAKRYYNNALSEPMLEYKKDVGVWGSHIRDFSAKRMGDLCLLQYNVLISLYNRMVRVRPLNRGEVNALVNGVNFPMTARIVGSARRVFGDDHADALSRVWHSAFAADGVHILNGVEQFAMPDYIRMLENMMK